MRTMKFKGHLLLTALLTVVFMAAFVGSTFAHPPVQLKDAGGAVLAAGSTTAYSAKATCGTCHTYSEIEKHSYHAQIGANQFVGWNPYNPDSSSSFKSGVAAKGKNWVQSPGHLGKW